jgi:hypothetical protein
MRKLDTAVQFHSFFLIEICRHVIKNQIYLDDTIQHIFPGAIFYTQVRNHRKAEFKFYGTID